MLLSRLTALCFSAVLFLALPVSSRAQFETRESSSVASLPFSTVLGDFNQDGSLDLVAASFSTEQVAVFLGKGNGTFQAPTYYAVGQEPKSLSIGDFNHDGNLDLAVTGWLNGGVISLLFGNGDGTFQPAIDISLDAFPIFVAVADFNGDGIPDLVVSDSPYVSVLLGNGDGTFQPPLDNQLFSPIYPSAIGVGDFNRDGKLDLVVAGQFAGTSQATILLGNGDGTFQLGASYSTDGGPSSVAVADLRGNGKLDLIIGGLTAAIDVFLGNGDGTFQPKVDYPTPGSSFYVATGDFNNDRKVDLAVGSTALRSGFATIFLSNGNGTFQSGINYFVGTEAGFIAVGDLNGDRMADLAVVTTPSNVAVLLNTGVVSFSPTTPLSFYPQVIGTTSTPQNVALTNTGTKALSIAGMKISGPFQLAGGTTCGSSVAPGAKCTLSIVFTPKVIGTTGGLLSISDSASSKPQVIELSGVGTVISLSPSSLNFGSQKVGTKSSPQSVTVTNTGSTTVSVTSVTITGANSKDYSQTNTCGKQIGSGGSCTISVTFDPTKTGTRTALVQINDNGGGGSQGATLTGVGD